MEPIVNFLQSINNQVLGTLVFLFGVLGIYHTEKIRSENLKNGKRRDLSDKINDFRIYFGAVFLIILGIFIFIN
jgi:hypothetical protein